MRKRKREGVCVCVRERERGESIILRHPNGAEGVSLALMANALTAAFIASEAFAHTTERERGAGSWVVATVTGS